MAPFTNEVPCASRPDGAAVVCRTHSLGNLASPTHRSNETDGASTRLVVWVLGEPRPRHVVRAPMRDCDEQPRAFSLVVSDLVADGDDELIIAADGYYNAIGSRLWGVTIIEDLEPDAPVATASSLTFGP